MFCVVGLVSCDGVVFGVGFVGLCFCTVLLCLMCSCCELQFADFGLGWVAFLALGF